MFDALPFNPSTLNKLFKKIWNVLLMQKDVVVDFMVIPNVLPISFVVLFFLLDILQFLSLFQPNFLDIF